jgi:ankyrin repeat protein
MATLLEIIDSPEGAFSDAEISAAIGAIEGGVDAIAFGEGDTHLTVAAFKGHAKVVKLLLGSGADVNWRSPGNNTPLYFAAQNGHAGVVDLLLSGGADVNLRTLEGVAPLTAAAQNGHTAVVDSLLGVNGVNIDWAVPGRATALLVAAQNNHVDIVDMLLGRGANHLIVGRNGSTALHRAAQKGHKRIVELLLAKEPALDSVATNGATSLSLAAQEGHTEIVAMLLRRGFAADSRLADGASPLFLAAQNGHEEVVKLLLEGVVNVNSARTDNGFTPILVAARKGSTKIVQMLLERGAAPDQAIEDGFLLSGATPIFMAASEGRVNVIEILLERGARVDRAMPDGQTPISLAMKGGHPSAISILANEIERLAAQPPFQYPITGTTHPKMKEFFAVIVPRTLLEEPSEKILTLRNLREGLLAAFEVASRGGEDLGSAIHRKMAADSVVVTLIAGQNFNLSREFCEEMDKVKFNTASLKVAKKSAEIITKTSSSDDFPDIKFLDKKRRGDNFELKAPSLGIIENITSFNFPVKFSGLSGEGQNIAIREVEKAFALRRQAVAEVAAGALAPNLAVVGAGAEPLLGGAAAHVEAGGRG